MHIFMDAFQGNYKLEPYDMRYFSAFYLILRFLIPLLNASIRTMFAIPLAACLMLAAAIVFTLFRPYKSNFHNKVDTVGMLLLALFFTSGAACYSFFLLIITGITQQLFLMV